MRQTFLFVLAVIDGVEDMSKLAFITFSANYEEEKNDEDGGDGLKILRLSQSLKLSK